MPKVTGYCVKCRRKNQEIDNPKAVQMKKTKMWAYKGKCKKCGTGMYRIVGKTKPAN